MNAQRSTPPTIPVRDLIKLRDEYRAMAARMVVAERSSRDPNAVDRLRAQARAFSGCIADLTDLIEGRKHPSDRRC